MYIHVVVKCVYVHIYSCKIIGPKYFIYISNLLTYETKFKQKLVDCPETSVINCQYTLHNIPEDNRSRELRKLINPALTPEIQELN
jgi:hypothetical protein